MSTQVGPPPEWFELLKRHKASEHSRMEVDDLEAALAPLWPHVDPEDMCGRPRAESIARYVAPACVQCGGELFAECVTQTTSEHVLIHMECYSCGQRRKIQVNYRHYKTGEWWWL